MLDIPTLILSAVVSVIVSLITAYITIYLTNKNDENKQLFETLKIDCLSPMLASLNDFVGIAFDMGEYRSFGNSPNVEKPSLRWIKYFKVKYNRYLRKQLEKYFSKIIKEVDYVENEIAQKYTRNI